MGYGNYAQTETKSFGQIILGHYEKILEIGRHELRPSERILMLNDKQTIIESEDTRLSYILAIENFGYALEPYFDETMKTFFTENIVFLDGFGFEIVEKIEDKPFKERLDKSEGDQKKDLLIAFQVKKAKKMFRELGKLMKRVDYLKSSVFGEGDDDVVEDED